MLISHPNAKQGLKARSEVWNARINHTCHAQWMEFTTIAGPGLSLSSEESTSSSPLMHLCVPGISMGIRAAGIRRRASKQSHGAVRKYLIIALQPPRLRTQHPPHIHEINVLMGYKDLTSGRPDEGYFAQEWRDAK